MSYMSQQNLDRIKALSRELEGVRLYEELAEKIRVTLGEGPPLAVIDRTWADERRIKDAERALDAEIENRAAEIEYKDGIIADLRAQIRDLHAREIANPRVFTQASIPSDVMRVRAVEDHDEHFFRETGGIYKGLWRGMRMGGYYDDNELLRLTDVEEF